MGVSVSETPEMYRHINDAPKRLNLALNQFFVLLYVFVRPAIRPVHDWEKKYIENYQKKSHRVVIFHIRVKAPPSPTDGDENLHVCQSHQRKKLCQLLVLEHQLFGFCERPNSGFSIGRCYGPYTALPVATALACFTYETTLGVCNSVAIISKSLICDRQCGPDVCLDYGVCIEMVFHIYFQGQRIDEFAKCTCFYCIMSCRRMLFGKCWSSCTLSVAVAEVFTATYGHVPQWWPIVCSSCVRYPRGNARFMWKA